MATHLLIDQSRFVLKLTETELHQGGVEQMLTVAAPERIGNHSAVTGRMTFG